MTIADSYKLLNIKKDSILDVASFLEGFRKFQIPIPDTIHSAFILFS